jgi:Gram-negative porin
MKKTLVAVAILAASGASFAQATITGAYVFGFTSDRTAAGATSDGLSTDTSAIQFSASEDMGAGMKASAKVSFGNAQRGGAVGGEDAYVQIEGGFGKVKMGAMESGTAYDVSTPGGGYGFDGKVYAGNVTSDSVTYTLPAFGAVAVAVGYADYSAVAATAGANGTDGGTASQASSNVGVTYAAGPLSLAGKYISYKNQETGANPKKSRYLARAAYDLGVAQIGVGFASTTYTVNDASQQTQIGVSAPVGALTLGAKWATNKETSAVAAGVKTTGYTLSADYALSKRTGVGASAYSWNTDGVSGSNTGFRVLVGHSF